MDVRQNLPEMIREILSTRTPGCIESDADYLHAAVLMPLFRDKERYKLLFTKRTSRVKKHKGQISFPGGVLDDDDENLRETALREAYEEIGLSREDVAILGRIDDLQTMSTNYTVRPFVCLIPYPYNFRINAAEVERLIEVPLGVFFLEDGRYRRQEVEFDGIMREGIAWEYGDEVIWGATAKMIANFVNIIGDRIRLPFPQE